MPSAKTVVHHTREEGKNNRLASLVHEQVISSNLISIPKSLSARSTAREEYAGDGSVNTFQLVRLRKEEL